MGDGANCSILSLKPNFSPKVLPATIPSIRSLVIVHVRVVSEDLLGVLRLQLGP